MKSVDILVVDDDSLLAGCLCDLLQEWGYTAVWAAGAVDAWEAFARFRPRALVTDNRMPQGSGLGLARRIKDASPETVVVMLSSDPPLEAEDVCDAVLRKPRGMGKPLITALSDAGVLPR